MAAVSDGEHTAALPMSFARFGEAMVVERDAVDRRLDRRVRELDDQHQKHALRLAARLRAAVSEPDPTGPGRRP